MNRKCASIYLNEIRSIFPAFKIDFWLEQGTLLGAIRDNDFIEWDNDVDLGIWEKDVEKICKNNEFITACSNMGFQFYLLKDKIVLEKKRVPINVSIFHEKNRMAQRSFLTVKKSYLNIYKTIWWILSVRLYNKITQPNYFCPITLGKHLLLTISKIIPQKRKLLKNATGLFVKLGCDYVRYSIEAKYFLNLKNIEFYGKKYQVPEETHKYLSLHYGHNWRTQKKRWVTVTDDQIIKKQPLNKDE